MRVAFLTAPVVPPAEPIAEVVEVPAERPELLVAAVPTAKSLFALVARLEAIGCPVRRLDRGQADPFVAVWLADAHENPEPLAGIADLILLGGGWALLRQVVDELEASSGLARTVRIERLGLRPGVYVPALFPVAYSEGGAISSLAPRPGLPVPVGLEGGSPFDPDPVALRLRHPRPALAAALGEPASPEQEAARTGAGERAHFRFGVGLTDDEPQALADWVKRFRHLLVARWKDERRLGPISVSLVSVVPRPWTPLQWAPMLTEEALKSRISAVGRELSRIPALTVTHDLPKWALLEGVLSRGDRRWGAFLLLAARVGWDRARLSHPLNPAFVLHRERAKDEILPWDHLRWGIDRESLWREYERLRG